MYRLAISLTVVAAGVVLVKPPVVITAMQASAVQRVDLAAQLAAGQLRAVNRSVTRLPERAGAVHVSKSPEPGLVWIGGTDFTEGTIELNVRGRDILQQSFVGIAFHRTNDQAYESVYLRPFNFRAQDPERHQHAVQYMTLPDYDWPLLRQKFPEEFENPVDASVAPTDWVALRVVVAGRTIRVYVGPTTSPALEVRKLGQLDKGQIGLWTGNNSDGDFADLRISQQK